jgi:hypothetical protein
MRAIVLVKQSLFVLAMSGVLGGCVGDGGGTEGDGYGDDPGDGDGDGDGLLDLGARETACEQLNDSLRECDDVDDDYDVCADVDDVEASCMVETIADVCHVTMEDLEDVATCKRRATEPEEGDLRPRAAERLVDEARTAMDAIRSGEGALVMSGLSLMALDALADVEGGVYESTFICPDTCAGGPSEGDCEVVACEGADIEGSVWWRTDEVHSDVTYRVVAGDTKTTTISRLDLEERDGAVHGEAAFTMSLQGDGSDYEIFVHVVFADACGEGGSVDVTVRQTSEGQTSQEDDARHVFESDCR